MKTLKQVWSFVRHNSGIVIGIIIAIIVLCWTYGCESKVVSIHNPPALVNRAMLELEVDHFLKQAEIRFTELDQADEFKRTIFAMAIEFMQGGEVNPVAIAITIGNIIGLGAIIDNVRKRTYINTLKGDIVNAQVKNNTS